MIIQGKIYTPKGYIDIQDIKIGDEVLNRRNRRIKIVDIQTEMVDNIVSFDKNEGLKISKDTILCTLYGKKIISGLQNMIYFAMPNGKIEKDIYSVQTLQQPVIGYKIILETEDAFYANNYALY